MRIENEEEVVLELRKTGLPVKTIPNMKAHTFKQQVNILSQAGILVSLHSSELINAMFLPQHAAIIGKPITITTNNNSFKPSCCCCRDIP